MPPLPLVTRGCLVLAVVLTLGAPAVLGSLARAEGGQDSGQSRAPMLIDTDRLEGSSLSFVNATVELRGDLLVGRGGMLSLTGSTLLVAGPPGLALEVTDGGVFSLIESEVRPAPEVEADADYWYRVEIAAGSYGYFRECTLRAGEGNDPDATVALRSNLGAMEGCAFEGGSTPLTFDGVTEYEARDLAFDGADGTDVVLRGGSDVDLLDVSLPIAAAVDPDSALRLQNSLSVRVADGSGSPAKFVDLRIASDGVVAYATSGFGGTDPRTRSTILGGHWDTVVPVRSRTYAGSATPIVHRIDVEARYGSWSQSSTMELQGPARVDYTYHLGTPTFTNVTSSSGVSGNPRVDGDTFGPGGAWGDYDNDGDMDLYVTDSRTLGVFFEARKGPNFLYRNDGDGTFSEVSADVGAAYEGSWGAGWADYDNDGDLDLYLTNYGGGESFYASGEANVLLANQLSQTGTATFVDVTEVAGVGGQGHSTSSGWADYDNDGDLDLYVGNLGIMNHMTWWIRNESNVLYRNEGDGTFTDVTQAAGGVTGGGPTDEGMGAPQSFAWLPVVWQGDQPDYPIDWAGGLCRDQGPSGMTFAVLWFDSDGDGDQDLLVGNDHGINAYYLNDGDGTFTERGVDSGMGMVGAAMGFAPGDYDADGDIDVYQPNFNADFLWRNEGDGTFEEVGWSLGLSNNLVGWGTDFLDYDNDGDLDLFVANGRVYVNASLSSVVKPASQPNLLYRNDGPAGFVDVSADARVDVPLNTMGAAFADYDDDGDVDIYVGNTDGPEVLLRNDAQGNGWLKLRPVGTLSNRDAIGLVVEVETAGHVQVEHLYGGGSFLSSDNFELEFGLGGHDRVDRLTLRWPSGIVQTLTDVAANQTLRVVEPVPFTVDAGPDLVVDEDVPVTLDGSATVYGNGLPFRRDLSWGVVDGSVETILSGAQPRHAFATPGQAQVTLTADDRAGTIVQDTVLVQVRDTTPPVVDAGRDVTVSEGTTVGFDGTNTSDNDPAAPAGVMYRWSFVQDGTVQLLEGLTPSWTFALPGTYHVTLEVSDRAGNVGAGTVEVIVIDQTPPAVEAGPLRLIAAGRPIVLAEGTQILDNDPDFASTGRLSWTFTVGTVCLAPVTLHGARASYVFESPGDYEVTLTAVDAQGLVGTDRFTVRVQGQVLQGQLPPWLVQVLAQPLYLGLLVIALVVGGSAAGLHRAARHRRVRRSRAAARAQRRRRG